MRDLKYEQEAQESRENWIDLLSDFNKTKSDH